MTVALALPAVAVPIVGAPGTDVGTTGVTEFEALDEADTPIEFLAVTTNEYDIPFVSPVTTADVALVVVVEILPGVEVMV